MGDTRIDMAALNRHSENVSHVMSHWRMFSAAQQMRKSVYGNWGDGRGAA